MYLFPPSKIPALFPTNQICTHSPLKLLSNAINILPRCVIHLVRSQICLFFGADHFIVHGTSLGTHQGRWNEHLQSSCCVAFDLGQSQSLARIQFRIGLLDVLINHRLRGHPQCSWTILFWDPDFGECIKLGSVHTDSTVSAKRWVDLLALVVG